MRHKLALGTVLLATTLAVIGCGGSDTGSTGTLPPNPDLPVIGLDIKFDKDAYTAPAGAVVVGYDNQGQLVHSMLFRDANGKRVPGFHLELRPGGKTGGTVNLTPGAYTMYCDIAGHEAAGMVASVTVG